MLAAFLVLIALFGLFLNWPRIPAGSLIAFLSHGFQAEKNVFDFLKEFSQGAFTRIDGIIVIAVSVIIFITLFLHTTKTLVYIRSVILFIITALLGTELLVAVKGGSHLYAYAGLLYTTMFFALAFLASIFKLGSEKSLRSTIQGKPMTESQALTQSLMKTISMAAMSVKVKIIPNDTVNQEWQKGEEKTFEKFEINIGRDKNWADVVLGDNWRVVSRRHGKIMVVGNSLFYTPIAQKYAFAINNTPYTTATQLPNNAELSLVSGFGPTFKIEYESEKKSIFHPKTVSRTAQLMHNEYKKLQTTMRVFVVIALLGIPAFGGFSQIQAIAWSNKLSSYRKDVANLNSKIADLKNTYLAYMDSLNSVKNEIAKKKEEIERLKQVSSRKDRRIRVLKNEVDKLKQKLEELSNRGETKEALNEVRDIVKDIDNFTKTQSIPSVFPIVTIFQEDDSIKESAGTGFFAYNNKGEVYAITIAHVLGGIDNTKAIAFIGLNRTYIDNPTDLSEDVKDLLAKGFQKDIDIEELGKELVKKRILPISVSEWKFSNRIDFKKYSDSVAYFKLPAKIAKEVATPFKLSNSVKEGDFVGVIGYPSWTRAHTAGLIIDVEIDYVKIFAQTYHGYSGSPDFIVNPSVRDSCFNVVAIEQSIVFSGSENETYGLSFRIPEEIIK